MPVVFVVATFREGYPEIPADACSLFSGVRDSGGYLRGTWGGAVIDELAPLPNETVIDNIGSDCFQYSELDAVLRAQGITHIYLAGQVTEHVVATTARRGANIGYVVTVLTDCCCGFTDASHDCMVNNVLPFYSTLTTSTEFAYGGRPKHPSF